MIRVDNANPDIHAKGGCYRCLKTTDLVDMEVAIDYEGVLVLCRGCLHDAAVTIGWNLEVTRAEMDDLEARLAEADYIAGSVLEATDGVQEALSEMRRRHRERLTQFRSRRNVKKWS